MGGSWVILEKMGGSSVICRYIYRVQRFLNYLGELKDSHEQWKMAGSSLERE
jgi:hypothetical protein